MKKFDLKDAKKGAPVCTRDGKKARIVCFDMKDDEFPILALIDLGECEYSEMYTLDGKWYAVEGKTSGYDLMMSDIPTIHHEGWVNIRYNVDGRDVTGYYIYNSKEGAEINCPDKHHTVKMSWEDEV